MAWPNPAPQICTRYDLEQLIGWGRARQRRPRIDEQPEAIAVTKAIHADGCSPLGDGGVIKLTAVTSSVVLGGTGNITANAGGAFSFGGDITIKAATTMSQGKTVLIETGVGEKERPLQQTTRTAGTLMDDLSSIGVAPEDVDVVVNTHLHADHCGWNTRRGGDGSYVPAFPRARYVIQQAEWDAATHPNERTRATYLVENLDPVAASGQLELIAGEEFPTPQD